MGVKEILTDDMLAAAFAFRRTELWERLDDSDIFAVRLSNGGTGYCCVMGNNGEHYGLGFYIGEKGFSTYLDMVNASGLPMLEMSELSMGFDCVNVDFEDEDEEASSLTDDAKEKIRDYAHRNKIIIPPNHGWPAFTRLRPGKMPYGITDKKETKLVIEALNAAVEVAKKIGEGTDMEALGFNHGGDYADDYGYDQIPLLVPLGNEDYRWGFTATPEHITPFYFTPEYNDDDKLDELDTIKKKGIWQCKVAHATQLIVSQDDIDYYPLALFIVNKITDKVLGPVAVDNDSDENMMKLLDGMADTMIKNRSVPLTIEVNDPRTYNLIEDFCVQEDINLNMVNRLHNVERVFMFLHQMGLKGDM